MEDKRNNVNTLSGNTACIHIYAGENNLIFHIQGKGNNDVKSLREGQRVQYKEGSNAKGKTAEYVVPSSLVDSEEEWSALSEEEWSGDDE